MKPLKNYLTAGSLVAIALFGAVQQFNSQSFFGNNEQKNNAQEAKKTSVQFVANTQATSSNTFIMARPVSKKSVAIAKLAKKSVPAASTVVTEDTTGMIDVATELPEIVAMQARSEDNEEITAAAAEQAEMEAAIRSTGGSAYHSTVENVNSPVDISAFASIKQADNGADNYSYTDLLEGSEQLKDYAAKTGSNTDYAIMVNLGLKSGKKRFFVIDLATNTIVKSGLVAEGTGDINGYEKQYSNEVGSGATSLGVFTIGKHAGKNAYRLQGLEESNSNAYKRALMLKSAEDVPNDEIGFPTLRTNGSLSLSTSFFKEVSSIVDESAKPVLLWVNDATQQNSYTKN